MTPAMDLDNFGENQGRTGDWVTMPLRTTKMLLFLLINYVDNFFVVSLNC